MVRKIAAGIYVFMPLGLKVLRKVENIVREEMDAAGANELSLSILQPRELWDESGRWDNMGDEMMRLKDRHGREFCLGPTHEEIITEVVRGEVSSHRDLPFNLYQIGNKYRDEMRPRFGLMRAREFLMKDAYSFHRDEADLAREYKNMGAAYERIFSRLSLDFRKVAADGGIFGDSDSHEFIAFSDSGEAEVLFCEACDFSSTSELMEKRGEPLETCPLCGAGLNKKQGVEVGQIFKLGDKYSKSMGLNYKDENMTERAVQMGCYGIGISRTLQTVIEQHSDESGIIWPEAVAPFAVEVVIADMKKEEQVKLAEEVYAKLKAASLDVLLDDRAERAGVKFKDADLIGAPVRITVGKKAGEGRVEFKRRGEENFTEMEAANAINRARA
jgi:prolyl-tRNA synthetase